MNASVPLRLKAFAIDYIFICAYLALLFVFSVFVFPSVQQWFVGSPAIAQLSGFALVTMPVSLYFIVCESRRDGQTPGKKIAGIRVVDLNAGRLSVPRAAVRTLLKFIPWELSHFMVYRFVHAGDGEPPLVAYIAGGVVYALMIAYTATAIFSRRKQALYDVIARTQAVDTRSL
ncbi:RDD family protein [Cohnella hongkongensis]|uniref:RDD family protein n=1 Tax=Cohnella hongkongensis TaxID=178337 RepID=A0ABV9FLL6_9BACL